MLLSRVTDALALEDLDEDAGLVVRRTWRRSGSSCKDGGVALDERGHDTSRSLESEREGRDIEEEKVVQLLRGASRSEDGSPHGGTVCDSLVGVDVLARFFAVEEVLEKLLDLGDAGRAANENNLVDLALGHLGIAEHLLNGLHAFLK